MYDGNVKLKQLKVRCLSGCAGLYVLLALVPCSPACHVSAVYCAVKLLDAGCMACSKHKELVIKVYAGLKTSIY